MPDSDQAEYADAFDRDSWLTADAPTATADQTRTQVDFLVDALQLTAGANILNVAPGSERRTLELGRRGYHVRSVHVSTQPVQPAVAYGAGGSTGTFRRSDVSNRHAVGSFDAAIHLSDFGCLDSAADDLLVLHAVAASLRPGGAVVVNGMNLRWHVMHNRWSTTQPLDHGQTLRTAGVFMVHDRQVQTTRTLYDGDSRVVERVLRIRPYGAWQLNSMLKKVGLMPYKIWGGLGGQDYTEQSPQLVMLARKPASDESADQPMHPDKSRPRS